MEGIKIKIEQHKIRNKMELSRSKYPSKSDSDIHIPRRRTRLPNPNGLDLGSAWKLYYSDIDTGVEKNYTFRENTTESINALIQNLFTFVVGFQT